MIQRRTALARSLRRRQTEAERRLWRELKDRRFHGFKFRRQHPIGRFVADFACTEKMLVVEIDGGRHAEREAQDEARTLTLKKRGWRVRRFWNRDVFLNLDGVLQRLWHDLHDRAPPLDNDT